MFELKINGEKKIFSSPINTIEELLTSLKVSSHGRIIELNGVIIDKEKISETTIKHLDTIEIIQFMGGG